MYHCKKLNVQLLFEQLTITNKINARVERYILVELLNWGYWSTYFFLFLNKTSIYKKKLTVLIFKIQVQTQSFHHVLKIVSFERYM